jgi:antiviral helicase SKI2|tara:strand:- start:755 stop:3280 length:2526 start_codon:yes stop_codon:yes gene_type:complete
MVKLCNDYTHFDEKYNPYFEKYPYDLSIFQKFAIQSIVEGHHSLSCVPTGSGKTLPALFAIDYFTSQGKKVIYTSPIKALSNQKYYEFLQKFPGISIGLLTGDIKINPEAQVLIMTAEILQNTLYRKQNKNTQENKSQSLLMFDMDFENELACVIQDEIHMINDSDRGHVWESTILLLPKHVQMVMLSATLDRPEKFALWIESRGTNLLNHHDGKEVYLAISNYRPVPLTHYSFTTTTQGFFKSLKDKDEEKRIRGEINKPVVIQTAQGEFQQLTLDKINKNISLFQNKKTFIKRSFVLNQLCKYMVSNNMLPAVCFILSRKQIAIAAHEITVPLFDENDEKSSSPYNIKKECEHLLRSKIPNFQEYLELPEYVDMVSLLEKGIAIHHSGIIPILREIVELLFEKGFIKLLFATETFSVGLNMPIKTVIFTDVKKFDGSGMRMFHSHEFVQAAGRAGRRGIDKVGNVIHLNNLFRNVDMIDYKMMMKGKPQTLVSKFKISYDLILNLIDIGEKDYSKFCERSMIQSEITSQLGDIFTKISSVECEIDNMNASLEHLRTPRGVVDTYIDIPSRKKYASNKARKTLDKEEKMIEGQYKFLKGDVLKVNNYLEKRNELNVLKNDYDNSKGYIQQNIDRIVGLIESEKFVEKNTENIESHDFQLTTLGTIASHIREVHCLSFGNMLNNNEFDSLDTNQLICIFSCFTNITVGDDYLSHQPDCSDGIVNKMILQIKEMNLKYFDYENTNLLNTGIDYTIHYDLLHYMIPWCDSDNVSECKLVLQNMEYDKGIFLGEFVKAILKINNISSEMEKVAEYIGNVSLLKKLQEIPGKTLKYVATSQSLYI